MEAFEIPSEIPEVFLDTPEEIADDALPNNELFEYVEDLEDAVDDEDWIENIEKEDTGEEVIQIVCEKIAEKENGRYTS